MGRMTSGVPRMRIQFFLSHGKTSNFLLAEFLQNSLVVRYSLCLRSDDKLFLVAREMNSFVNYYLLSRLWDNSL